MKFKQGVDYPMMNSKLMKMLCRLLFVLHCLILGLSPNGLAGPPTLQQITVQQIAKNFKLHTGLHEAINGDNDAFYVNLSDDRIPHYILVPDQLLDEIAKDLDSSQLTSCKNEETIRFWKKRMARMQVQHMEELMEKYGKFIPLPQNPAQEPSNTKREEIAAAGIDQEFFVYVMGHNPSHFKEEKYCPGTHRVIVLNGKRIEMCPNLPVDSVGALNMGNNDSDVELIEKINGIYKKAGINVTVRRPTRAEFNWADTEGGANPKLADNEAHLAALGAAAPHWQNANKDPHDPNQSSPSGAHQPRPISDNMENSIGFRRTGVWEWVEDTHELNNDRVLIGGSWASSAKAAESGGLNLYWPGYRRSYFGPARLVRMLPSIEAQIK